MWFQERKSADYRRAGYQRQAASGSRTAERQQPLLPIAQRQHDRSNQR